MTALSALILVNSSPFFWRHSRLNTLGFFAQRKSDVSDLHGCVFSVIADARFLPRGIFFKKSSMSFSRGVMFVVAKYATLRAYFFTCFVQKFTD